MDRRAPSATVERARSTVSGVAGPPGTSNGDQSPNGKSSSWIRSAASATSNFGGVRLVSSDPLPSTTLVPTASRIASTS